MHMTLKPTYVNTTNGHVSGRGIRRRKLPRARRVRLAADLASGELRFDPSLNQVCELLQVPAAEVRTELKTRAAARENEQRISTLIEAWHAATGPEREAAIAAIGVDVVWDALAGIVA